MTDLNLKWSLPGNTYIMSDLKLKTTSSFIRLKVEDQNFTDITDDFAHHFKSIYNSSFSTLTSSFFATSKLWSASIILTDAVITTFNRLEESSQCVAVDCLSSCTIKGFQYLCSFVALHLWHCDTTPTFHTLLLPVRKSSNFFLKKSKGTVKKCPICVRLYKIFLDLSVESLLWPNPH